MPVFAYRGPLRGGYRWPEVAKCAAQHAGADLPWLRVDVDGCRWCEPLGMATLAEGCGLDRHAKGGSSTNGGGRRLPFGPGQTTSQRLAANKAENGSIRRNIAGTKKIWGNDGEFVKGNQRDKPKLREKGTSSKKSAITQKARSFYLECRNPACKIRRSPSGRDNCCGRKEEEIVRREGSSTDPTAAHVALHKFAGAMETWKSIHLPCVQHLAYHRFGVSVGR
ncbi:hypothetical protein BDK51DRAFT_30803 [Blyttiomyces helicus]|uniref:Uncharacterized protein n=1 Tax=Blyttiomyces helicus TaxID=388810 RepID=A0A4P9VU65_9FUNG|nr:hypothetical protein BDK51DRAFT_30803 [Blyttiomyces helicus]|eukprot:RKO83109.1 hypothetical protein BDK51DRAFT_30803 [Blyttiomyces helicus]